MDNKEYAKQLLLKVMEDLSDTEGSETLEKISDNFTSDTLDFINQSKLESVIQESKDLYYNVSDELGEPYLSDKEYDLLERIYKDFYHKDLPVGSDVRGGKIPLPYPMGSLDQNHEGDTLKWIRDNGWLNEWFVIGDKQDGTSGLSQYFDGEFRIAYSRGNGTEGADITRHIKKISNVPLEINSNEHEFTIRYEVIVPFKNFEEYSKYCKDHGLRVYKNPRNFTAGKMNSEDGDQWFYDNAKIIVTSVINSELSKSEEYELLSKLGFEVTPWIKVKGKDLTDEFLTDYLNERRRDSITEIDGIVIDIDSKNIRNTINKRENNLNPRYSRKYKIADESNLATTEVVKVHWRASKSGYLKPRVEIKPVELAGVTVTYTTGFNAKFIVDNGIGPGAVIQITRAGDVIPHILSATKSVEPQMPEDEYYWNDTDVDIILEDVSNNREVLVNKLCNIFGMLDVPFLRQGSIEKLVDAGYTDPADIIKMDEKDLKKIVGDSAGSKIFNGMKDKLNPIPLHILAGSSHTLGRGMGRRRMEMVAKKLGEEAILDPYLTVNKIMTVDGFALNTATLLKTNLPKLHKFLDSIKGYYTLKGPEKPSSNEYAGLTVCFTGVRDKDLEAIIKSKGGEVIGSVKKLDNMYLVCKDPNGSSNKIKDAKKILDADHIITLAEAKKLWQ